MADSFQDDYSFIYEVLQGESTDFSTSVPALQADTDPSSVVLTSTTGVEAMEDVEKGSFDLPSVERGWGVEGFVRRKRNGGVAKFRKDFYRSQHIRALKKSLRQLEVNKFPTANIHKITNTQQACLWQKLREVYLTHADSLRDVSRTTAGPLTDGRNKREEDGEEDMPKTHNDSFVQQFFASPSVRIYHLLFCDLVFQASPQELCAKMHIGCCVESSHTSECQLKWQGLKEYTQRGMLLEAGVATGDVEAYEAHLL